MTAATLRAIRIALGLTQRELAAKLPAGYSTLRDWERGHPIPPLAIARLEAIRHEAKLPDDLPPAPPPRRGRHWKRDTT